MKPIIKTNVRQKTFSASGSAKSELVPQAIAVSAPRRKFSLSNLTSTAPTTAEDIRRVIAQGRFAELKPDQA